MVRQSGLGGSPHEELPFALGVPEASPEGVVYFRRAVLVLESIKVRLLATFDSHAVPLA
ncbi:MAG: hypothetical protein ACYTXC_03675 [Nostoc sp.]